MSEDLVARLRALAEDAWPQIPQSDCSLIEEAADTIARLQRERDEWEEGFKRIASRLFEAEARLRALEGK